MPRKKKDTITDQARGLFVQDGELVTDSPEIAAAPRSVGRPSKYTGNLADLICTRIALGNSLRKVCLADDMPDITTIIRWTRENKEFCQQYDRACVDRGNHLAEEALEIADQTPETEPVRDKDGEIIDMRLHSAYVSWQKNRVDARRWFASKMSPKRFGDKVQTEVSGIDGSAIQVETVALDVASLTPESRAALRAALLEVKSKV
jgi:hypothetical protein